jgi:large subunit ribosomal protein L2
MNALLYKKPTNSSQRYQSLLSRGNLISKEFKKKEYFSYDTNILKNKSFFIKNEAGRNHKGNITVFTKGGGHKKKHRIVFYDRQYLSGIVEFIEYDPYRSSNIARIFSEEIGKHFYILAPEGLKRGHFVCSQFDNKDLTFKIGNTFHLKDLPLGIFVHNVLFDSKKTGIARAAGCSAQIISKDESYCRLRLNSGEHRLFKLTTNASLGSISNPSHKLVVLGKAGRSRWLNKRPSVRGVAMNPIDHPHGGGEGKTSGGRPSVTAWGKVAKGQPTRKKKSRNYL